MLRRLIPLAALALGSPFPANAQTLVGAARVIDGDTLEMAGARIRLLGIDAPERAQTCRRGGALWACGQDATALMAKLVGGRDVSCEAHERDSYGRLVATCHAGVTDLGGAMVREGLAVTLPQFPTAYLDLEARAKRFGMALWGSQFQTPADYRRTNAADFAPPAQSPVIRTAARPAAAPRRVSAVSSWSYRNCAQARRAGAAPIYRGQPGYGAHMDGDGDGVACEPYRR